MTKLWNMILSYYPNVSAEGDEIFDFLNKYKQVSDTMSISDIKKISDALYSRLKIWLEEASDDKKTHLFNKLPLVTNINKLKASGLKIPDIEWSDIYKY